VLVLVLSFGAMEWNATTELEAGQETFPYLRSIFFKRDGLFQLIIRGLDYDNRIIWYFDAYFSLFLVKDPVPLPVYMKLIINVIGSPTLNQRGFYLCMFKKNSLSFNNIGCQTSTSKLYNLDYIISTTFQII
jgi:hypothetical protein